MKLKQESVFSRIGQRLLKIENHKENQINPNTFVRRNIENTDRCMCMYNDTAVR